MSQGHYTPAGFVVTSTGTPAQAELDDNGNLKVNVIAGGVGGGAMTVVDGGDVAEGSTSDVAWVSGDGTVISLLKTIASSGGGGGGGGVPDTTSTGSIAALNQAVTIALDGKSAVGLELATPGAAFVGVVTFQSTIDGSTWITQRFEDQQTFSFGLVDSLGGLGATSSKAYLTAVAGRSALRVICTSYTSGSLTVALRASAGAIDLLSESSLLSDIDTQSQATAGGVSSIDSKTPILGQAAMAASIPVVIASDQSIMPVTTGAATSVSAVLQNAATAPGNGALLDVTGMAHVVFTLTQAGGLGGTIVIEASEDGSTFQQLGFTKSGFLSIFSTANTNGAYEVEVTGYTQLRARISVYISGTITVTAHAVPIGSRNTSTNLIANGLIQIWDSINTVAVKGASTGASVSDPAFVVAVSPNNSVTVAQATAANLKAQVQGASASGAAKSGNPVLASGVFNTTQPTVTTGQTVENQATARGALIVGTGIDAFTVSANAGTNLNTSALALDATLTGRTTKAQITDGTRDGTVKAASTLPALTDTAVVTTQRDPLPAGTNVIGHVIVDTAPTTAVTGPLTDTQLRATAVPVSGTVTTSPPSNASTNVAQLAGTATSVNSGTKDAGTLRVVLATDQPALTNKLLVTPDSVALPANQSVNISQFGGTNASTGTGASGAGIPRVTVANDSNVLVTPPTLTKGTQSATGFSTQDLKDSGRNQTNYFMAAPVACTAAEVMQSMSGYKGGIAVAPTVSPAVVTSGKTYRIDKIKVTIIALTAIGSARINLRANLSGAGVIGSPLVMSYQVGIPAIFTAGSAETYSFDYSEGMEFPAGTGLAIGVIGEGADGSTATAVAKVMVSLHGYEY